jgi:O-antigen/teichoic acid export membrane protein
MTLYESRDTTLRGAYWQYISSISLVLIGGLFYIFLIHFYTTQIVGVFSLLSAITYLFSTIFTLGLLPGIQHFISYHLGRGEDGTIKLLFRKFSIIGLTLSLLGFVTLWFLSPVLSTLFFHTHAYLSYLRLIDVQLFPMIFLTFLLSILLGLQSFRLNGILSLANNIIGYGLIIPLLLLNADPIRIIYAWIIGYYVTTLLGLMLIHTRMKKYRSKGSDNVQLRPILTYSVPMLISGLIGYGAIYVDRFIVSFLLNLSELGIYNFSLLIVNALGLLIGPFGTILFSRLSEFYGRNNMESFRLYSLKVSEILTAVYVPVTLIVASLSPSILLFLANTSYLSGEGPIMIILITSSLTVSANVFAVTIQAIRKTRLFILSSSIALLANFALSLLLIPHYGLNGAAVGYASPGIANFLVIYYFSRKYGTFAFEFKTMLKIYGSGFVMFLLMLLVQDRLGYSILKLFTYIVTGFAVYFFLIRVTGAFSESDIDLFLTMIPQNYARAKKFFKSLFV